MKEPIVYNIPSDKDYKLCNCGSNFYKYKYFKLITECIICKKVLSYFGIYTKNSPLYKMTKEQRKDYLKIKVSFNTILVDLRNNE